MLGRRVSAVGAAHPLPGQLITPCHGLFPLPLLTIPSELPRTPHSSPGPHGGLALVPEIPGKLPPLPTSPKGSPEGRGYAGPEVG